MNQNRPGLKTKWRCTGVAITRLVARVDGGLREGHLLDRYLSRYLVWVVGPFRDMATDEETGFQRDIMSSI